MKAITKTELQHALQKAGIPFKSKAPKAELEKLLADNQPAKTKSKANGHAKGAKATLREKFTLRGYVTSKRIDNIAANLNVTRSTVMTAMSDLQNPKYAGPAGPLNIEKDDDGTYRLAK